MTTKRIVITIVGGALLGGLAAAVGVFADNTQLVTILTAASGLAGALVAYFGGE